MGIMASWGSKKFEINTGKLTPITGLTTVYKLKTDANSDTSGTTPTNTRGRELEEVTFNVQYISAAGVNVRVEFGSWRELIGQSYPLIIGGVRFGPEKFQLQSASISETMLDVNGNFLAASVALSFKEYVSSSAASTATAISTTSTATKGSGSASKSMKQQIEERKKEALNVTAPSDDKAKRSSYTKKRAAETTRR